MRLEWIWSLYDAYIIIYQQWYILVNLETGDIHKYSFLNNLCLKYIIWDINNRIIVKVRIKKYSSESISRTNLFWYSLPYPHCYIKLIFGIMVKIDCADYAAVVNQHSLVRCVRRIHTCLPWQHSRIIKLYLF